ncbi:hypothetical protein [Methylobacterium haplocladii]|uniref:Uncharacterized protein n=1 Tax=Methylobacterium haplocladii TaxID=1176176 RepID=A0A512IQ52_9HYPH|nr:hypothetical protein [Methylobacterium haplocladii]GEO99819.1 hypothetical protein MHA02_22070 [Methylobacterium haplocladii]GJD84796.1 hypothetical protein HPGCJGGD_2679 [Methylobacterium haplocladii]GLS59710.1 hypothetical protein GCM10007887_23800 [Methylobacterium haplocladii]
MAQNTPNGRTPGLSMAEFNARAKKIAASTGEVEKGSARRSPPSRFRRDSPAAPKPAAEPAGESETTETEASESSES